MDILCAPGMPPLGAAHRRALLATARRVQRAHTLKGFVHLVLTDDEHMRRLNTSYRGRNDPTDVLCFELQGDSGFALPPGLGGGEIYLSLPRAAAQAEERGVPLVGELLRLLVHALLHLAGFEHDTPQNRRYMERESEKFLEPPALL